jgi:hypothetical protein
MSMVRVRGLRSCDHVRPRSGARHRGRPVHYRRLIVRSRQTLTNRASSPQTPERTQPGAIFGVSRWRDEKDDLPVMLGTVHWSSMET